MVDREQGRSELRARIIGLQQGMSAGLLERDEPARLLLLAALAGEHALLIGPPGTAKSELARRLRGCLDGEGYFERLLTRFSVPEELFGPLSIQSLERDEYRRLTDGYLPTATVAFLDEIFNANSAILNALLTLLNEREFDNGTTRVTTPLACVVGASNQLPEGPELSALHDRFLVRCLVRPVSAGAFDALLEPEFSLAPASSRAPGHGHRFTPEELAQLRRDAARVPLPVNVRTILGGLRARLNEQGIYVSDRRWRKIAALLRMAAHCDGREAVGLIDCWLVPHCLWEKPEQIEVVEQQLRSMFDAILLEEPRRFQSLVDTLAQQIQLENTRTEQACDEQGMPLFLDEDGFPTTEPYHVRHSTTGRGEALYQPPPGFHQRSSWKGFTVSELWEHWFQHRPDAINQLENWINIPTHRVTVKTVRPPVKGSASYAPEHVAARRKQLKDLMQDVLSFQRAIVSLRGDGDENLWISPTRFRELHDKLDRASAQLSTINEALLRVVEVVNLLPTRTS